MQAEMSPIPSRQQNLSLQQRTAELQHMTVEQLRQELQNAFRVTADHMLYLAAIWKTLEARGEDLSELRAHLEGLAFYIPLIAQGKVDAQAIARFSSKASLVRAVAVLPIGEQKKLGGGDPVLVCVRKKTEHGPLLDEESKDPLDLTGPQIKQVFGPKGIRTPDEQRDRLQVHQTQKDNKQKTVRYNPEHQTFTVGKVELSTKRFSQAMAEQVRPAEIVADKTVPIQMYSKQAKALHIRAQQMNKSPLDLLSQILYAYGIGAE